MNILESQTTAAWVQAGAACLQAFLSAGAVFAAWWLQDRSLRKRDEADRARSLEGAAAAAIWALQVWRKVKARASHDGMDPTRFVEIYRQEEFGTALRALRQVPVAEFGDEVLTTAMFELEAALERAERDLGAEVDLIKRTSRAANALSFIGNRTTDIFNPGAGVERRVAELTGRVARESLLSQLA